MKRKMTALLAGAYIASQLSLGAVAAPAGDDAADGAGDIIGNIGEGAGDVLDGIGDGISDAAYGIGDAAGEVLDGAGDAAGEVLDGAGDAAEEITGNDPDDDEVIVNDEEDDDIAEADEPDGIAEVTDDDDVDDELTEDDDDRAYEIEMYSNDKNSRNPATGGLPFMTAGLVAVTAAGVAYLTKKRNIENGQDR